MNEERKSILDYLKEYGIDIEEIAKEKAADFLKEGYHKVSGENKGRLNAFFEYIPALVTEAVERKDVANKSKVLLDGAYKVSITEGMHLAKSKAAKGAYRGSLLSDLNNQVAGQAELFKIGDSLNLIRAPKYALCLFDSISMITGQYYMAEINHRLAEIDNKVESILDYLKNKDKAELWANDQILDEVFQTYHLIKENTAQKEAYYQQVLSIKKQALAKMKQFNLQIKSSISRIHTKSKDKDIQDSIKVFSEYYPQYWFSIYLYAKSVFCEIALAEIDDPVLLEKMKTDIIKQIEDYKASFARDRDVLDKIIGNAKAYNSIKLPEIKPSMNYSGNGSAFDWIVGLYGTVAVSHNLNGERKATKQRTARKKLYEGINDCSDTSFLEEATKRIDDYKKRTNGPIDFIQYKNETYVKFLDEHDNEE